MKTNKHNTFSNICFAVTWYFKISPLYVTYQFLSMLIRGAVSVVSSTYLVAHIITCVEEQRPLKDIIWFIVPLALILILQATVSPLVGAYITPKFNEKFTKSVNLRLYDKAVQMEISKYDNPEFYNDFVWAMEQAPTQMNRAFYTLRSFANQIVTIFIAGTYIVSAEPIMLLAAVIIIPISYIVNNAVNKLYLKQDEELNKGRRKRDYAVRIFYLANFVKDIKQGKIAPKLEKDFEDGSAHLENTIGKFGPKIGFLKVINDTVQDFVWDGGFLIYLFYQAIVKSKFALGTLLAVYNSGNRIIGGLRYVTRIIQDFNKHSLYIEKIRKFLDTENEMEDTGRLDIPENGDIRLQNVSFTYSGNETPSINNVSLEIKKGEKIALVGFNGAGKTTLIKLILRLYDATSGKISYGGNDIKKYPLKKYRGLFGVLFQDFEIIAADISQNISMSDQAFDTQKSDEILKKVGFWERFNEFEDGYKTQLTKEFSDKGINLSGGEAQKIALARVLYATNNIIVLDEPSSALDPIAEYKLNKAVTELSRKKTVIIISHRLSTTRFVDKIYMLENGRIAENGTHNELMDINGKYAEMYRVQAEKYKV